MSRKEDINDLINLGLDADRLEQHTDYELSMAMCAVQESGIEEWDDDLRLEMGLETDEKLAAHYAEAALGWC